MIKIKDVAWGRLTAPDLDAMEEFLVNFGMVRVERTKNRLYMRGTGPAHHLHITELADTPRFIGAAFYAKSEDDLKKIAKAAGASGIEHLDEPGGGQRVRLKEPNGYQIEIVHGIPDAKPIKVERQPINWRETLFERTGDLMRLKKEPAHVMRMGHVVLFSPKVVETTRWFRETLGLIQSDDVYAGTEQNIIGTFSRADNGEDFVDHHIFFCAHHPEKTGLHHLSFEVEDIDDVFVGHEFLKSIGKYKHHWGIGRHLLGSQVYDYWRDPWGRVHEHWTDSDRLNVHSGSHIHPVEKGLANQWGSPPPPDSRGHVTP
jgi:catechol 2,3-dioxygenase-like lactoylglutathione lyase family enzyme